MEKAPFHNSPYTCLIVSLKKDVKNELKEKIADFLVKSHCLYVLCTGKNYHEWENLVNLTYLRYLKKRKLKMTDKNFITTTIHKSEKIDDIIWHFLELSTFGYYSKPFKNYLLLFIGKNKKTEERWLRKMYKK